MNTMKKFITLILTICIVATCFTMSVFAADGKIMFEDPTTSVGKTFSVKGVVEKSSGNFGKIKITMKYDTSLLDFQGGEGVTETSDGVLVYEGDATHETGTRKEFYLKFKALKEGTADIKIQDATIKNISGATLNYTKGTSKITINAEGGTTTDTPNDTPNDTPVDVPGDSVTNGTIEVKGINGKVFAISNLIPENEIPEGYEEYVLTIDGVDYNAIRNEDFCVTLAYLVDEDYAGKFFRFEESDATFAPYEEFIISDTSDKDIRIVLLTDLSDYELPERYVLDEMEVNGAAIPVWVDTENTQYRIVYAVSNNSGERCLYQYDRFEGTYQKFEIPEVVQKKVDNSLIGKATTFVENHLEKVILFGGIGAIFMLLIIVILSVKLYNRNAELDELYDEYGFGDDSGKVKKNIYDLDEEEYDDYNDVEESEDTLSREELAEASSFVKEGLKEFTEDDLEDFASAINETPSTNVSYNEEATLGMALEEVVAQQGQSEEFYDDDEIFENFSVDFIDLDD